MFDARPAPSPRRHDLFAAGPGVLWGWVWIYPKTTRRAGSVHLGGRPRAFLFSSHFFSAPLQLLALVMPRQRQCSMYFPTLAAISSIFVPSTFIPSDSAVAYCPAAAAHSSGLQPLVPPQSRCLWRRLPSQQFCLLLQMAQTEAPP